MLTDALLLAGILGAFLFSVYRLGSGAAMRDNDEKVLDDVHKANVARDDLRRDPDFTRRVRDRFTRGIL